MNFDFFFAISYIFPFYRFAAKQPWTLREAQKKQQWTLKRENSCSHSEWIDFHTHTQKAKAGSEKIKSNGKFLPLSLFFAHSSSSTDWNFFSLFYYQHVCVCVFEKESEHAYMKDAPDGWILRIFKNYSRVKFHKDEENLLKEKEKRLTKNWESLWGSFPTRGQFLLLILRKSSFLFSQNFKLFFNCFHSIFLLISLLFLFFWKIDVHNIRPTKIRYIIWKSVSLKRLFDRLEADFNPFILHSIERDC